MEKKKEKKTPQSNAERVAQLEAKKAKIEAKLAAAKEALAAAKG